MSRRSSSAASLRSAAPVFAALGDTTRLGIVARLSRSGPASIAELTADSGVTRQAVAKHLRVLEDAGLVRESRAGRETSWKLLPGGFSEARTNLDQIARQWEDALGRLKAFVERR